MRWVRVGGRFVTGQLNVLSKVMWVTRGGIGSIDPTTTLRGLIRNNLVAFESLIK
jgi:hypothetical protein